MTDPRSLPTPPPRAVIVQPAPPNPRPAGGPARNRMPPRGRAKAPLEIKLSHEVAQALGLCGLALICAFVAFGFVPALRVLWAVISFPVAHFHLFWAIVRALAMCACGLALVAAYCVLFGRDRVGPATAAPSQPVAAYRENSPFGDAALAQREQLSRALMGSGGYARPTFED